MNLGRLYEAMPKEEKESSCQRSDESNSHSSVQPVPPVKVVSHRQFHDNVASRVAQKTH